MQFHFKKLISFVGITIFTASFGLSGFAANVQAATSAGQSGSSDAVTTQYTLLTPLPELNGNCPSGSTCNANGTSNSINSIDLSQFISYAYKFMLALAVVLAVFMITVGGFEYMLSGAANTKSDALKKIQDAVWGLLLALVAYLLLYTIDPNLVSPNNMTIPPIIYSSAFTQTNGATTALQLQQQQDQQTTAALNQATSLNDQAQQDLSQADQIYQDYGCEGFSSSDPNYPAECKQADALTSQASDSQAQALNVQQKQFDSQTVSSVQQALLVNPAVVPCSSGPALGASQCYQGYQLNPQAQAAIQQQMTNLQNDRTSFTQQMSQINGVTAGDQNSVVTESQGAANQIETQIQTAISKGAAQYQQEQGNNNAGIYSGGSSGL
jgi:hypothetical protein